MTSRERVLAALRREEPDRVPYMELGVDRALAGLLLGWKSREPAFADLETNPYDAHEMGELAAHLWMDNVYYVLRAPVYAHKGVGKDGRRFYGEGLVRDRSDLAMVRLPDPADPALYREATESAGSKEDRAACLVTRAGIFPTILSMGLERFSVAVFDDRPLVEELLDRYFDWAAAVAERAAGVGFDVLITTDDMAFKTAPYLSPALFRDLVMPRYRRFAQAVKLPWIMHTDGNIVPYLEDLLGLGISGIHPLEKGAVDIRAVKRTYGKRLCLLGNVDLGLLAEGTAKEVEAEVRGLIRDLAPGGGYIVTSGNSLTSYCRPENVMALSRAVRRYGSPGAGQP